jgi:hypothetical protein
LLRKIPIRGIDHPAHSAVRGRIVTLTGAGGADPMDVGAAGIRMRNTDRETNQSGTCHRGGTQHRTKAS